MPVVPPELCLPIALAPSKKVPAPIRGDPPITHRQWGEGNFSGCTGTPSWQSSSVSRLGESDRTEHVRVRMRPLMLRAAHRARANSSLPFAGDLNETPPTIPCGGLVLRPARLQPRIRRPAAPLTDSFMLWTQPEKSFGLSPTAP